MLIQSLIRIVSCLIVGLIVSNTSGHSFFTVMIVIALTHYLISPFYSLRQIRAVASRPVPLALFLLLIAASIVLIQTETVPVAFIFLPHFVFNEVYLNSRALSKAFPGADLRGLTNSALAIDSALYCSILRFDGWGHVHLGMTSVYVALVASTVWFVYELWKRREHFGLNGSLAAAALEILGFAVFAISFRLPPITAWHMAAFHFSTWLFYPVLGMQRRQLGQYALANLTLAGAFISLLPELKLPWHVSDYVMNRTMYMASIVHIMTSFALSRAQPKMIWQIFLPLPTLAAVGTSQSAASAVPVTAGLTR